MENLLPFYLNLNYTLKVVPDPTTDGSMCYLALYDDLPGCMSHGDTPEEAITNLQEAKELYIETLLEKGEHIPVPKSSYRAVWEVIDIESTQVALTEEICQGAISPIEPLDLKKENLVVA